MNELYRGFLEVVRCIINRRIGELPQGCQGEAGEFANSVLEVIESEEAIGLVVEAFSRQHPTVREAFEAELRFFNARYPIVHEEQYVAIQVVEDAGRGFEDADTVKESLEKLIGIELPKRLKDIFDILNELLKLFRP